MGLMAERCVSGEFNGSAWHAAMSPTTARMGISRGANQHQMRLIASLDALLIDNASKLRQLHQRRLVTSSTLFSWNGGGSATTKNALVKITQKLRGMISSLNKELD
jgi:hypothetical protein